MELKFISSYHDLGSINEGLKQDSFRYNLLFPCFLFFLCLCYNLGHKSVDFFKKHFLSNF